jgi:hypothetical protein
MSIPLPRISLLVQAGAITKSKRFAQRKSKSTHDVKAEQPLRPRRDLQSNRQFKRVIKWKESSFFRLNEKSTIFRRRSRNTMIRPSANREHSANLKNITLFLRTVS